MKAYSSYYLIIKDHKNSLEGSKELWKSWRNHGKISSNRTTGFYAKILKVKKVL